MLWMTVRRRMHAGVMRCGHPWTETANAGGVALDRFVPFRGEKELRDPICELNKIPPT
jgi:hypothetical protein